MFYHLMRSSALDTAAGLIGRAAGMGWRVMVRGTDPATLTRLDDDLWRGDQDAFLPHGREGGPHDADQPVLIGQGPIANDATALVLLDSAATTPAEAETLNRVWIIFDGANDDQLTHARSQWRALTEAGLGAEYWSEETGRWQKKLEKPARTVG